MIAGIELGGTKTVVAVGKSDGTVSEEYRFPTAGPDETFGVVTEWLLERGSLEGIGVAAFGPISVNPARADFGRLMKTPKPGWAGFSVVGTLEAAFPELRVALETDVNAAVLAEAGGLGNVAYITIGTGIGAGVMVEGVLLHGTVHSEFGHWFPQRAEGDEFAGVCPFHGDCLEGLASGTAMRERWGREPKELLDEPEAWEFEVHYLAQAAMTLLAAVSPSRVVIGGGVSQAPGFHAAVEQKLRVLAGGYFAALDENTPFVVPPEHGQQAGIRGALMLPGR